MNTPAEVRKQIRAGKWNKPTTGFNFETLQANIVILPVQYAGAFKEYTRSNPKSCPVLEVIHPGSYVSELADGSDIRKDVPKYRIYRQGEFVEQAEDVTEIWQNDFVTFLIGCSFTFENALIDSGIRLRHIEEKKNVAMYRTNIETVEAGPFHGPMVVSMRPVPQEQAQLAAEITEKFPRTHGGPVHIGDPREIGIQNLDQPDYGEAIELKEGEVPVFWACGVTPQEAVLRAKLPIAITHEPGHMFVMDKTYNELD
ncbi:putative hydro-lyase [Bacillus sp. FJAT-44742]|uniref:putative hydro-lyase n=1 Tax=Bacillus sp. FJAT-44742 TaxID=2014005 RepID=UPI000C245AA6|nr:putative hydro-lyase [Bacillus sp. FJAT-44742]